MTETETVDRTLDSPTPESSESASSKTKVDEALEGKRRKNGWYFTEATLLNCLLKNIELVPKNSDLIKESMFSDDGLGLLYRAMVTTVERGAREFTPKDLANRMLERDSTIDLEVWKEKIERLIAVRKFPKLHTIGAQFWEEWRKREAARALKTVEGAPEEKQELLLQTCAEVNELMNLPNPFKTQAVSAFTALTEQYDRLSRIWDGTEVFPKIPSGFPDLDRITDGGFDLGSLAVLGATTGHGKTATAVGLALSMAKLGTKSLYISMEMPLEQISLRMIAAESGVPLNHLIKAQLITPEEQKKAFDVMEKFVDESLFQLVCGKNDPDSILGLIRTHAERDNTQVFFVDYIQRACEGENRTPEIARFVMALGELARELNVLIIGTSQMRREGQREAATRKPTGYDLSESAFLQNEASYIITLFRQDMVPDYEEALRKKNKEYDHSLDRTIEMIMCKQRNGMTDSCHVGFDGPSTRLYTRKSSSSETPTMDDYEEHVNESSSYEFSVS